MKSKPCPLCLEGELVERSHSGMLVNKGIKAHVDSFLHSVCSECDAEIADAYQTKHNKLLAIEFQRITDGYLPPSDVARIRKKLKLSSRAASSAICGGGNAFSKYENGVIKQSSAVDNLLRLLDDHPELLPEILLHSKQRALLESYQATLFFQVEQTSDTGPANAALNWITNFGKMAQSKIETLFRPAVESTVESELTPTAGSWKALT